MPVAALLFNGLKYPFGMIDRALSWAQRSGGTLLAIFLKSAKGTSGRICVAE